MSMDNAKVVIRESNWHKRKVKEANEAIYINRELLPRSCSNSDQAYIIYHLPAIYSQIIPPKFELYHITSVRPT